MSHTETNVEKSEVDTFVTEYLCGRLDVPRRSGSSKHVNMLVFHMPKTHTNEKYSSGKFDKTYSGGSLKYYIKSKTLVLQEGYSDMANAIKCRDRFRSGQNSIHSHVTSTDLVWNMKQLWDDFRRDPTPKWIAVQANPRAYDGAVLSSGKHQGKTFVQCYGSRTGRFAGTMPKYVEWLIRGEAEDDPTRGKTSLGMRMFYEYCIARAAQLEADPGQRIAKRPASALSKRQGGSGDEDRAKGWKTQAGRAVASGILATAAVNANSNNIATANSFAAFDGIEDFSDDAWT